MRDTEDGARLSPCLTSIKHQVTIYHLPIHGYIRQSIYLIKLLAHRHNYDSPFGGKLDSFLTPLRVNRIYSRRLNEDHSPFQPRNKFKLSSSSKSGIQNPALYSLSSLSICCFSKSSRVLEGRPGLLSLCSCVSSSL
jgi:hypothetical protein